MLSTENHHCNYKHKGFRTIYFTSLKLWFLGTMMLPILGASRRCIIGLPQWKVILASVMPVTLATVQSLVDICQILKCSSSGTSLHNIFNSDPKMLVAWTLFDGWLLALLKYWSIRKTAGCVVRCGWYGTIPTSCSRLPHVKVEA